MVNMDSELWIAVWAHAPRNALPATVREDEAGAGDLALRYPDCSALSVWHARCNTKEVASCVTVARHPWPTITERHEKPYEEVDFMDGTRFDTIAQRLATGASRRQLVGGLLGGAAAALTGAAILEAAPGGNGKGKGKGKNNGNKGKGKGKGKTKVYLCHKPNANGEGTVLQVSGSAKGGQNKKGKLRGHERHGDVECPVVVGVTYVNGGTCTVTGGVAECQAVTTTA